jgi:hypothetical protein
MNNKERAVEKETIVKYFNALNEIKQEIESGEFVSMDISERRLKLSNRTCQTLQNLKVIKRQGGRRFPSYIWNDKIPVTMLLAKKVILENRKIQYTYKSKPVTIKPVDGRKLNGGARLNSGRLKSTPIKIESPKKVSDVGLIRRFLRWIY